MDQGFELDGSRIILYVPSYLSIEIKPDHLEYNPIAFKNRLEIGIRFDLIWMSWAGLEVNRSLPNNNIGQHGLIKTSRAECKAISFSMSFYGTKNENDITKMAVKLFQGLPTLIVWIHTLARRQVKYENQSKIQFSFWPLVHIHGTHIHLPEIVWPFLVSHEIGLF